MARNSDNPRDITYAALKQCIERHEEYARIASGDVDAQCSRLTPIYSACFKRHGIHHVTLCKDHHHYLAVRTSDRGVLAFDPTIRQFFPEYPEPYFLDSAEALASMLTRHGLDTVIHTNETIRYAPTTARLAYFHSPIDAPLSPSPRAHKSRPAYLEQWVDALHPLSATSYAERLSVATHERSSRQASP